MYVQLCMRGDMREEDAKKGISRRQFLAGSVAAVAGTLASDKLLAQTAATPQKKTGTKVILLGTGGGPRPNKVRNQSSQVVIANGIPYVIDCGGGVSRQMVFAGVPLTGLKNIFITHNHSDHNLE